MPHLRKRFPYPGLLPDGTMPPAPGMAECPDCKEILLEGRPFNFHSATKHGKGPLAYTCNPVLAGRRGGVKSGEARRREADERRRQSYRHQVRCYGCGYEWEQSFPPRQIPFKRRGGLPPRDPATKRFVKAIPGDRPGSR